MKELRRARRVGYTVIACAVLWRLLAAGVPERLWLRLVQPNIDALVTKLETGRNVRFSVSSDLIMDFFRESPAPWQQSFCTTLPGSWKHRRSTPWCKSKKRAVKTARFLRYSGFFSAFRASTTISL